MSSSIVAVTPVVAPIYSAVATAASAVAVGAAAVGIPTAFAYGAAKAIQKMASDYESALCDFQNRQSELDMELARIKARHAARLQAATEHGRIVDASSVTTGMPDFLSHLVRECVDRAAISGAEEEVLAAQALVDRALAGDEEVLGTLEELHQKIDQIVASRASKSLLDEDWRVLVAIVERDLGSPLLGGPTDSALMASIELELRKLEGLPPSERPVAIQGLEMLRSRLKRELKERTVALKKREKEAIKFRLLAGEALAGFQSVASNEFMPDRALMAKAGLKRLSEALTKDRNLSELEGLAGEARELYDSTMRALQAERVANEIGDVLKEMGYQLSPVETREGTGCQIALSNDTGLTILVDEKGQIKTEMVAYDERASRPSADEEEKVCDLVSEVFQALNAREIEVRERTRKKLKLTHRIPVVPRPQFADGASAGSKQEARRMNVDGR